MSDRASEVPETVIPFPPGGDPLDRTGQIILDSLRRAASTLTENIENTVSVSHKLSLQLRDAQDRIKELEAQILHHKDRADRAEQWLHHISQEIEQRFFASAGSSFHQAPTRQTSPLAYARKQQDRSGTAS